MDSQTTARYYLRYPSARLTVLLIICISAYITPLSLSAALVAIPAISTDLSADAVYASWIPAAFLLSNLIGLLPGGRLADLYGRKRLFLYGNFIFALASLLAAFSPNIEFLLLMRVIQGLGASMFFSTGMAILGSVYQNSGRGAAIGWMVACVYFGLSSGPLVGGWLIEHFGWHSVFFTQAPLATLCIVLGLRKMKGEWVSQETHRVDWLGVCLFSLAITLLFIGITNLFLTWGQLSGAAGGILFYLFVKQCGRSNFPLVNFPLLKTNRMFSNALIAQIFMYSGQYGLTFLMGLFLQYNRGLTPTETGQLLMLQAIVMAICAPVSGKLSDKWGAQLLATSGCLLIALGQFCLTFVDGNMPIFFIAGSMMLIGLGHGLFSTPNNSSALGTIPESRMGFASALLSLSRLLGQLLGTAIVGVLLAWYVGNQVIDVEHYDDLKQVTKITMYTSLSFALLAAYCSAGISFRKKTPEQ